MIETLRNTISKSRIYSIAQDVSNDEIAFTKLINLIGNKEYRVSYNASWTASHAVEINPNIISEKHHKALLETIQNISIGGIRRNIIKIWQHIDIPESQVSDIVDLALKCLSDPKEDIAVRAYAITILQNCLRYIPEIKEEVMFILEIQMPHFGPACMARARRFIKRARKY